MAKLIVCKACGEEKPHYAKGLCKQCYMCQWRESNHEHRAEYHRRWCKAHPGCYAEYRRQYRAERPEEIVEYMRQWREKNREHNAEYNRQWARANREKRRETDRRRRALKNGATIGPVDEVAIYERDKVCIYCGATEDLTLDHVVALNNGGPHCQDNLAVACRRCNSSKGTKPLEEWLQTQPKARERNHHQDWTTY